MGHFALRFEEKNRPLRRGKSITAPLIFAAQFIATTLLMSFMFGLSWVLATGDTSVVERFLSL